jgi:hypothetical protein
MVVDTPPGVPVTVITLLPKYVDGISTTAEAVFSANHSIFAFANAGQRFRVYAGLQKGTISQLACSISGQMENVP